MSWRLPPATPGWPRARCFGRSAGPLLADRSAPA
jgi:hypothetical protein